MLTLRHTLLIFAFCLLPLSVHAATRNVPAQYATIQAGINAAVNGDTVLVADGTYSGDGNRDIDFNGKNITVKSVNGASKTIIDCQGTNNNPHRGFYIHSGETSAVLNGFTVKNGTAVDVTGDANSGNGGGIYIVGANADVKNCDLLNNTARHYGGGIYNVGLDSDTIRVIGCDVSGNTSGDGDGGVSNYAGNSGRVLLSDCTVHNNKTLDTVNFTASGGGVGNQIAEGGAITLNECRVYGNAAGSSGSGGNVNNMNQGTGVITLNNCVVSTGAAAYGGGVLNYLDNTGSIKLNNCTVSDNTAFNTSSPGGGVYNHNIIYNGGAITLTDTLIYGNHGGEVINSPHYVDAIVTYSDVRGGYAGTGNINADPLFVNAAGGDFHLRAGSPVIGKGVAVSGVTTDLDGRTRPNPPSIGAYEFVAHTFTATHVAAGPNGSGVLLWNSNTGAAFVQTVTANGATTRSATFGPYAGASAKAVAVAPDGSLRLLWTNTNRTAAVWSLTAAGAVTSTGTTFGPYAGSTAAGMTVTSDGKTRLLWTNTAGAAQVWTLDTIGRAVAYGPTFGPYSGGAHVSAIGGGGDGLIRLLWTNTAGAASVWVLNANAAVVSYGQTYGPYNGASALSVSGGADGKTRLLWTNTSGAAAVWALSGTGSVLSYGTTYGPYTGAGAYDLSVGADNVTRLLWANTSGQAQVWSVSPTGGLTYSPNLGPF